MEEEDEPQGFRMIILKAAIIELSDGDIFEECMAEWAVEKVNTNTKFTSVCLCSYPRLQYNFPIRHIRTGKIAIVGSKCIQKFGTEEQKAKAAHLISHLTRTTWDCERCKKKYKKDSASSDIHCNKCLDELALIEEQALRELAKRITCVDCKQEHVCADESQALWKDRCPPCYDEFRKNLLTKSCLKCNGEFKVESKQKWRKYCGRCCQEMKLKK